MSSFEEVLAITLRLSRALAKQTRAIDRQTKAISALAASNEALVQALMEPMGDEPDPDAEPTRYMDGTPVRDN